ncbi:hypothetical protein ACB098_02G126900 [Castanea mollissima]
MIQFSKINQKHSNYSQEKNFSFYQKNKSVFLTSNRLLSFPSNQTESKDGKVENKQSRTFGNLTQRPKYILYINLLLFFFFFVVVVIFSRSNPSSASSTKTKVKEACAGDGGGGGGGGGGWSQSKPYFSLSQNPNKSHHPEEAEESNENTTAYLKEPFSNFIPLLF